MSYISKMEYGYYKSQLLLAAALLLCFVSASITAELAYPTMGSKDGAEEVDANLHVYAKYPTILEMQWEIFEGDAIRICQFTVQEASNAPEPFIRDCIDTSSHLKRGSKNFLPSSHFPDKNFFEPIDQHSNISIRAKRARNISTGFKKGRRPSPSTVSKTQHWKQAGVSGAHGSWTVEGIMGQETNASMKEDKYFNITGLDACTAYDITLKELPLSFDPSGSNQYYYTGEVSSERTPVDETEPPKSVLCKASEDAVEFSWNLPFEDCPPTSYVVTWTATSLWSDDFNNGTSTVVEPKLLIGDPLVWAKYKVTVNAVYNDSFSNGAETTCATPEQKPSEVENVSTEAIGSVTIRVTWNVPATANGNISEYVIYYENTATADNFSQSVSALETSYNITDLDMCATYNISIEAVNGAGHGPPSETVSQTLEQIEEMNLELVCTAYDTNITAEWNSLYRDCKEVSYDLQYSLSVQWEDISRTSDVIQTNSSNFAIIGEDFIPGTVYNLQVSTVDEISASCVVTSLDAAPSEPQSFSVQGVTSVTLTLTWQDPESWNGRALGYNLICAGQNFNTTENGIMLTNLDEGTFYEIFLKACNHGGCSDEVSTIAITATTSAKANTVVIVLSVMIVGLVIVAGLVIAIVIRNKRRDTPQPSTPNSPPKNNSLPNSSSANLIEQNMDDEPPPYEARPAFQPPYIATKSRF